MKEIHFEWDEEKNLTNIKKHGVSFAVAKSVFYDNWARVVFDSEHSQDEDRFIILGLSSKLGELVVSHCYRTENEIIRIISARKATKNEKETYWRFRS